MIRRPRPFLLQLLSLWWQRDGRHNSFGFQILSSNAFTAGPGLSWPAENTQKSFQIIFFNIFILVGITIHAPQTINRNMK